MSYLIVTFGHASSDIPVMNGRNRRTEKLTIAAPASDPVVTTMVCDAGSNHGENIVDLFAEAKCWVEVGAAADAVDPSSGIGTSFVMNAAERLQFSIVKGDIVSVVAY